jgi:hypothetical protein
MRGKVLPGEFSDSIYTKFKPDYAWRFTEKIDGTNIRVYAYPSQGAWEIKGRTENAQLNVQLITAIDSLMTHAMPIIQEKFESDLVLYGEGYGPKIQQGSGYSDDYGLVLFDIKGPNKWFEWPAVQAVAELLGFETVPVVSSVYTLTDAVDAVRQGFTSEFGKQEAQAEGIVGRLDPEMYVWNHGFVPLRWKLKTKDFYQGDNND